MKEKQRWKWEPSSHVITDSAFTKNIASNVSILNKTQQF